MAARLAPARHRLFIAREDWRDDAKHPSTELQDPSIGAWELLRRNNQYTQDFADWHQRVTDFPPIPFPQNVPKGVFLRPRT
ncbi:transcriptional regulator domain-containing protein [Burkholderia sp. LMG 21824]|uniref:transcriptional regulator domain-containing protein n=1 Tax=Burkholderia sp. LMG 21824 TaxID=3158172 RepID=UPI003C2B3EEB